MDLRRLSHLVALADERNFVRAAERVHLSQPALSRSVQAAEAELGLKLFDRGSLEVTCTGAGTLVVERARKLIFDSRCLERDVALYRDRLAGDIAFGVGPFPAAILVPALMIELRTRYPGVNTRIEVNNWRYLVQHLRAEELDFFVAEIRDVTRDEDLAAVSLGRLHGSFFVRTGHPLLRRKAVRPNDMVPFGVASVRLPVEVRDLLGRLLGAAAGDRLPIAVECDDVHLLRQIVRDTDTVLASVDMAVRQDVAAGLLQVLPLQGLPPVFNEMGIVSLRGRSYSPMAEFAVGYLGQLAAVAA